MEWKTISFNDKYEVSDTGLVRTKATGHIHSGCITYGYKSVKLTFDNSVQKRYRVNRLVAQHFIKNDDPIHKTFVNHINGDKLDNRKENLEWVSPRENNLHYYQRIRKQAKERKSNKRIAVDVFDKDLNFIKSYPSMKKASEDLNIAVVSIARCVHKELDSACGYIFIPSDEGSTTRSSKSVRQCELSSQKDDKDIV